MPPKARAGNSIRGHSRTTIMASSKTLSTTTLNLRFMQNALRSQAEKVELPKAPVKDDGEWEVSQAVRDAWGLNKSSASR